MQMDSLLQLDSVPRTMPDEEQCIHQHQWLILNLRLY